MPTDLLTAIVVMSLLSLGAGLLAGGWLYSAKGQRVMLCLTVSVLAMVFFLIYAAGQLSWARLVPSSAAIIYTNFAAILAALAAGWSWRLPNTPVWRRGAMTVLLAMGSLVAIFWSLLSIAIRPPPAGGNQWKDDVAMQTSWATCSPAAAATLFRGEGINVSEAEMIPLCLSDSSGTPTLGLYRGIKLVAQENGCSVEVLSKSLEQLLTADDWPVLLTVRLPFGVEDRGSLINGDGFPGMGHSVVALRRSEDGQHLVIGDPAVGLELWSEDDLRILWHGGGLRVK